MFLFPLAGCQGLPCRHPGRPAVALCSRGRGPGKPVGHGGEMSLLGCNQACPHVPLGCRGAPFVTSAGTQLLGAHFFPHFSVRAFVSIACETVPQSWQGRRFPGTRSAAGRWGLTGRGVDCRALGEGRGVRGALGRQGSEGMCWKTARMGGGKPARASKMFRRGGSRGG